MDTKNKANAECQLNKSDSNITKVCHGSGMLYFRPETEEIIVVPSQEAGEFEAHCLDMMGHVDEFHQANHVYSAAIEKYGQQKQQPGVNLDSQAAEVVAAENDLEKKREDLLEKLKDGETSNMGYQGVVELLPLLDTRRGSGNQRLGRRYAYASQRYFSERSGGRSQAGARKKWRTVTLKNKDTATGQGSIYSVDSRGRRKIDTEKLKKQLTTDILPVIKLELKDYVNLDDYNLDKTLFDWAESWNSSLVGSHTFDSGVEVSGAAQFMRFISNVGAEAEFNPNEGSVKIKGEAKASMAIASGISRAVFYMPDRLGWDLSYRPQTEDEAGNTVQAQTAINMGVVRIYIENQLIGFVGASAQLEAQLQVMVKDGEQQIVAGQPQGRLPRFTDRQSGNSGQFYQQMKKEDEGASASAEAFAGASVEYSLKGAVQWLKPTPPAAVGSTAVSKTVGEFTDFATLGASIAGLAGIGAGAKFLCTFINGKFCFKVAASLCCGVGAKGAFLCEVGGKALLEFGSWLAYQLFTLDYRFFELVAEDAFKTFTRMCVMQIADLAKDIYAEFNVMKEDVDAILRKFGSLITTLLDESKANFEASKRRNQLAKNIIAEPERLLNYTPEAKGILLYLLTRHGKWDHADLDNRGSLLLDIYFERKEAVIQVLNSIQTQREWLKVMCHRSKDGSDLVMGESEQQVVAEQERQLREFLQEGFNRDQDMNRRAAELAVLELSEIYGRLKSERELSWGYALAMNNTSWYNLNRAPNPHFPQRCEFGPCEATITKIA
ncbi:ATPase [Serratia rubidaea]|uniref:ATPase n=1 Tax=Serratia rubidaea TaxID=61652 RepID=A0ABS0M8E5_SERRU|nr:ATPase [Serratia rubidaea]MBH1928636.1 ATPase [Serratia rubidaea]MEB7584432.1 ATPase [Serratia rubidaea]